MAIDCLRKTPLNTWHRAQGAKMVELGGWDMPLSYRSGTPAEHLATRRFGGLFDVSHMGRIRISGKNRLALLQHVLSSNVEALDPWQAQYTLIPDEDGSVIDDGYLYRFGADNFLLAVNAANFQRDWSHLRQQLQAFADVVLEDQTEALAMIAFQGPLSGAILGRQIERGALPEPFRNRLSEMTVCGTRIRAARTGYSGEPLGFELFVPAEAAEEIWSRLYEAGRDQGVLPVGLGTRDSLRLEAGLPLYSNEFGPDPEGSAIPAFALPAASVAVSFSSRKGDYVGRAALARQFEEAQKFRDGFSGPSAVLPRQIRAVALVEAGTLRRGDRVFFGQREAGVITSGGTVPYWKFEGEGATVKITEQNGQRALGLAYLDSALLPPRAIEVAARDRRLKAEIVPWHGRSDAPPYFRPLPVRRAKPKPPSPIGEGIEKAELLLRKSLDNHEWRQRRCINLIPSEMTPSPLVRLLQVSDPVGRYAEHKEFLASFGQEVYYYQGTDFIAWVEDRLGAEMGDYLGCSLIEARTISGQMANTAVFSALVDFKNRLDRRRESQRLRLVINNHIGKGGHLSAQPMGALRDYVAKDPVTEQYAVINFPVREDNPYQIDLEKTAEILERVDPELIIFGKSMTLHPEPLSAVRKMVAGKAHRPVIMYDTAHVLGLLGPHFQQPFREGVDILTGSTHKTFFGPQRGVIAADFAPDTPMFDLWKAIRRRVFPGMLSNHHLGTLLALLLAIIEMNTFKDEYQRQVIANAKAFARALKQLGLDVQGDPGVDFTETHQVVLKVGYARGCEVARNLEKNNIIVNYQAIPGDESFTCSSALRMGVAEMTRFGMKEKDFEALAPLLAEVVGGNAHVGDEVAALRRNFHTMCYCFDGESLAPFKKKLLRTF